ncbi:MAG: hypothetical protein ACD_49C00049G0020 [uncultured bacterium (gcode 4)]|uniref:Uncharacterized protein n=1 Tax=uncultured bacterium (gcode 4) TaxID=1234023 RepID=K2AX90_9BACT|nr:MAG: hypothetical protein ACD_49C00049G0020 [uncultured bacterium (gcode 4)]
MITNLNEVLRGNLGAKHWVYIIGWNDIGNTILDFIWLRSTVQYIIEVDKNLYFSGHYENKVWDDQKIKFMCKWKFYTDDEWNIEFSKNELKAKWINVNSKNHLFWIFNDNIVDIGCSGSSTENINGMIRECRWASVKLMSEPFFSSHWPLFKLTYELNKNWSNHNILLDEETLISSFKKISEYINKENSQFVKKVEVKKVKVSPKIENIHNLFEKIKWEEIFI